MAWPKTAKQWLSSLSRPACSSRDRRLWQCVAQEISDSFAHAPIQQAEYGPLRIRAMDNPGASRHFSRPINNLAAASLGALGHSFNTGDVEIVEPKRKRQLRGFREHAADWFSTGGELLVAAHRAYMRLRLLPAEELGVKSECLFPVGGEQLVPAHMPQSSGPKRLLLAGLQLLDQGKHRLLGVGDDRKAADIGNVRWRDMHRSAKLPGPGSGSVHIADADIADPMRRHAHFSRLVRQFQQPSHGCVSGGKHAIGDTRHRSVPRAPAYDTGIEGLSGFHICRHQLVPDETAMRIDHLCFSIRACREDAAPLTKASRLFFH